MDNKYSRMRCSYCIDTKKNNSFTTGCNKFKKDSLRKHATTVDHCTAVEARSARKDMQQAVANVNCSQEKAVVTALKTVYFMAKKNLANDIFGYMKQFLILQVRNPDTYCWYKHWDIWHIETYDTILPQVYPTFRVLPAQPGLYLEPAEVVGKSHVITVESIRGFQVLFYI